MYVLRVLHCVFAPLCSDSEALHTSHTLSSSSPADVLNAWACFDAVAAEQLTAVPAAVPPPVQVERMTAVAARCCVLIALPLVAG